MEETKKVRVSREMSGNRSFFMSLSFSEKKWTRPEFFKLVVDLYTLYGLVCFYFIQKSRKNRRLRLFATAQNPCSVHWQQKTQKNASLGMKLAFFSTALKIQCGVFFPIFWINDRGYISSRGDSETLKVSGSGHCLQSGLFCSRY